MKGIPTAVEDVFVDICSGYILRKSHDLLPINRNTRQKGHSNDYCPGKCQEEGIVFWVGKEYFRFEPDQHKVSLQA